MSTTSPELLWLADWRRRLAELYAEVRDLAATDPAAAHARWRAVREALYRDHPSSPVPADRRADFRAIHFPYDPGLRFELPLVKDEPAEPLATSPALASVHRAGPGASPGVGPGPGVAPGVGPGFGIGLPTSIGQPLGFDRIGRLEVPFGGGPHKLALFWLPEYSGGLFLAFRDGTNGRETYGGGRYVLDTGKGADLGGDPKGGTVVIDFNFAYQPSCAFDPHWSCPLAPPENRLPVEIRGGERIA